MENGSRYRERERCKNEKRITITIGCCRCCLLARTIFPSVGQMLCVLYTVQCTGMPLFSVFFFLFFAKKKKFLTKTHCHFIYEHTSVFSPHYIPIAHSFRRRRAILYALNTAKKEVHAVLKYVCGVVLYDYTHTAAIHYYTQYSSIREYTRCAVLRVKLM